MACTSSSCTDVATSCSNSRGEALGTTSGDALACNASTIDKVVNGLVPVINRVGSQLTSLTQLESNYIITPINGGVWAAGQTFTAFNQFMGFNGVSYKPKLTTSLPYIVGATPIGDSNVEPFSDLTVPEADERYYRKLDTVGQLIAATDVVLGQTVRIKERGNARFKLVLASTVTTNTFNIIQLVGDPTLAAELEIKTILDLIEWGAGLGLTDDRPIFQSAVDQGFLNFENGNGTYLIGASATTIPYRATTTIVGVDLPSNVSMKFSGYNSIVKVLDSSNCVPFTANGKTNITLDNFRLEGNALNQTGSLLFGIYFLNCTGLNIAKNKIWVNESKDNTIEIIGCTDVDFGTTENKTSTAGGSIGGGPQFEDCSNVTADKTIGATFDDLVSVIAHANLVKDHSLGEIQGISTNARALFIGQSGSTVAQRLLTDITAKINSSDSGLIGLTAAFTINNGGIYKNLNIDITDRSSFQALRITPFDATFHGELKNCKFNIVCYNPDTLAVDVRHDNDVGTIIANNKLSVICRGPNFSDASTNEAVKIQGGDGWDIDVNIEYPPGKVNAQAAMTLGITGSTNSKVTNSNIRGYINGGKTNIRLNNTDNVLLDNLILANSEEPNDINVDITSEALNTKIGTVVRDGEIQDLEPSTQRSIVRLFNSFLDKTTSGTVQTDLESYTLPANFMGKTGTLHIKASGVISGANANKTLLFHFGGTSHTLHAAANDTGDWSADIYIHQSGNRASQRLDIVTTFGSSVLVTDGVSDTISTTSPVTIKFTGLTANTNDSISQRTMFVEGS